MKVSLRIALLACVIFFTNYYSVSAQTGEYQPVVKKKATTSSATSKSKPNSNNKYFDESGDFASHLQYALHFSPGLSFSSNNFNFRLDPSVGYKINKWASAGLTGGLNYAYVRASDGVSSASSNLLSTSIGVYGRVLPIQSFPLYIHVDVKSATYKRALEDGSGYFIDPDNRNHLLSESQTKPEVNVGLGYRTGSGQPWGFELLLLYNVVNNNTYYTGPFDFKVGATYNF